MGRRGTPGEPVVNTSPSSAGGMGSVPGQGAGIPHASWPKNQNINNRGSIVINSIETLKMVHNNNNKKSKKKSLKKEKKRNRE